MTERKHEWEPRGGWPFIYRCKFCDANWSEAEKEGFCVIGCHCGCCGRWIEGQESKCGWGLCDSCANLEPASDHGISEEAMAREEYLSDCGRDT